VKNLRKSVRIGLYTLIICAIATVLVVLVNVLASLVPASVMKKDTTTLELYRLSDQTKSIVESIDEDITLYLIAEEGNENIIVSRLIEEYTSLNSHLKSQTLDPVLHPAFTAPDGNKIDISDYSENTVIVCSAISERIIEYSEIFQTVYSDEDYEYYYNYGVMPTGTTSFYGEAKLTGALEFVCDDNVPVLYMLTGHGEYEFGPILTGYLSDDNYALDTLSLIKDGAVPDDAACVIIYYPQSDINFDELALLEDYIVDGGNVVLISGYLPGGMSSLSNLCALGANCGIELVDGLVVEGSISNSMSGYPYYLLPNLEEHEITNKISDNTYVLMTAAHGLAISQELADGVSVDALLLTTDTAFVTSGESVDASDAISSGKMYLGLISEFEDKGAFVWYSSPSICDDEADSYVSGGNSSLVLSTFSYLTGKDDSVSIAAKSMAVDSLVITDSAATFWTVVLTIIIPLFVVICGLGYWIYRRKRS